MDAAAFVVPYSRCPAARDPAFALALVCIACGAGHRLLRAIGASPAEWSGLSRRVVAFALGLGLLQVPALISGALGQLRPPVLLALLLVLVAVAAPELVAGARRIRTDWRGGERLRRADRWTMLCVAIVAVGAALQFMVALAPATDGDSLGYHLAAPRRWLSSGNLRFLPTLVHTNGSMGMEMVFTLCMALWSDTAARVLCVCIGLAAAVSVGALVREVAGVTAGARAAAAWAVGVPGLSPLAYFALTFVDLAVTLEVTAAVLAWLVWRRSGDRAYLIAALLCAGFAGSFKTTALVLGPVLIAASALSRGARARDVSLAAAAWGAPIAPWLLRAAAVTGNPVYPLLSGLFPTRDWNAGLARVYPVVFRLYNLWGRPDWSLSLRWAILGTALLMVAVVALLLALFSRDRDVRALIVVGFGLLAITMSQTGLTRRMLLPYTGVCLAGAIGAFAGRRRVAWAGPLVGAGVAAAGAFAIAPVVGALPRTVPVAIGATSRTAYLRRSLPLYAVWERLNREPGRGVVLIAGLQPAEDVTAGMHYYADRECRVTDAYHQGRYRLDRWPEFLSDVRRDGITWLVTPDRIAPGFTRMGPDFAPARNELAFAHRLAQECADPVFGTGRYTLWRLRTGENR